MSGWHSLSGYLQYKSGNALGRLITKKRVWCVLEESQCQLRYFKQEEDVHHQKAALGHIDIIGAAISLDLENQNQFVVLSDGKEHFFTAENHESMMIWLLGLQGKRESHTRKLTERRDSDSDENCKLRTRSKSDLCVVQKPASLFSADQTQSCSSVTQKFCWDQVENHKWSLDSALCMTKRRLPDFIDECQGPRSRSLPPVFEGSAHLYAESSSCESDDVFREEARMSRKRSSTHRKLRSTQSLVTSHQSSHRSPLDCGIESTDMYSSRSASSDSAIDKGEGTPQELTARLMELEKELISTKCELAKVMNRQTCYSDLLQQKEDTIKGLEDKIDNSGATNRVDKKPSVRPSAKMVKMEKDFHEKIRVLQNQNRFLNEEVKKLARIRLQEHGKYQEQNQKLQNLEADIEKWKIDYVTLIQSSIRFPGDESVDDIELCLYGGDRHRKRVQSLLEEARKINPSLPSYESLANNDVHVDGYGFKHVYTNTGLLLHYLCTELTHHYLLQAGVYEEHQRNWTMFMRQHGKAPHKCKKQLKVLCRKGIPDRFRKQMWRSFVYHTVKDSLEEKGQHYYRNLCNMLPESPLAACYRKQISLDLMRTMPSNIKFSSPGSKGIMDLQDVLLAFCVHNPTVGYCQGMNFIVGMTLLFMDAQDAFWTLVAITERYFSPHYFDHSLIGAQADQQMLKDLVHDKLPELYQHLEGIDIELSTITLNWFLAIFFDAVPFQTLLRIWDCFLLEGPKVLFRFSLAILKLHERDILQKTDTIGIMKHLKACAKLTYDVDGLVKLVFEDLKPFPKRRDILSKQTCYLNALKEKHMKKELQRLAFAEREQMYMTMEAEAGIFMGIECATAVEEDHVWLCYGDQHIGKVSCVDCEQGTMCSLDFKLDSRVMCMCAMRKQVLVLGTISWMLLAYSVKNRKHLWQIQLHDAILSVCCYDDSDTSTLRIFCGLADGTLAVLEPADSKSEPNMDVLYIPIGQAPVTCLMLLDDQIWCASGNNVAIVHARTLDSMDTFSVSVNPYDHILSLVSGDYGIWISLRGSSILELWDPQTLNCRMLYDTRTDRYPQLRKEDDTYFNRARITSILADGHTVWVGTGEGNMIMYEVLESAQLKTPMDRSPSVESISTTSHGAKKNKQIELDAVDLETKISALYKLRQEKAKENASARIEGENVEGSTSADGEESVGRQESLPEETGDESDDAFASSKGSVVHELYEEKLEEDAQRRQMHAGIPEGKSAWQIENYVKQLYEEQTEMESRKRSSQSQVEMFLRKRQAVDRRTSLPVLSINMKQTPRRRSLSGQDIEEYAKELVEQTLEADARRRSFTAIEMGADMKEFQRKMFNDQVCQFSAEGVSLHVEDFVNDFPQRCSLSDCSSLLDCQVTSSLDPSVCSSSVTPHALSECSSPGVFSPSQFPSSPHQKRSDIKVKKNLQEKFCQECDFKKPKNVDYSSVSNTPPAPTFVNPDESDVQGQQNNNQKSGADGGKLSLEEINPEIGTDLVCKKCFQHNSIQPVKSRYEDSQFEVPQNDMSLYVSKLHEVSKHSDAVQNVQITVTFPGSENEAGMERKLSDTLISRHDKVDSWLSSLSTEQEIGNHGIKRMFPRGSEERQNNSETPIMQTLFDKRSHQLKVTSTIGRNVSEKEGETGCLPSAKEDENTDDVDLKQSSSRRSQKERHEVFVRTVKPLDGNRNGSGSANNGKGSSESDNVGSDISQKPTTNTPKDPAIQYRLEFSGMRVETDSEIDKTPWASVDDSSGSSYVHYLKNDSRRSSLDVGAIQEKSHRFDVNFKERSGSKYKDCGNESMSDRQRIFEFLKTPSLASRQMSLGLKIIEDDLEWTDLCSGQYSTISPSSSVEKRLADFMKTPSISSKQSSLWSSYENISTPSQREVESATDKRFLRPSLPQGHLSHSASTASMSSNNDVGYTVDLGLEVKVKISDKPVKCLLSTRCKDEPIILSFAGSYGDDEAVLKWKKRDSELMWTNEPVLEVCPKTHMTKLPQYMRRRLSSGSSFHSHSSGDSSRSHPSNNK